VTSSDRRQLCQDYTHTLLLAGRQWRRVVNAAVERHGLSDATAVPLLLIGRMEGDPRQNALAEAVGIEGPSLVRLLDQLGAAGLVVRKEDPTDRRAKVLSLTPAGEAVYVQIEADLRQLRETVFGAVSTADIEAGMHVFQVLKAYGRALPDTGDGPATPVP
jgi:MarR family transcriptional regulator for hemolysin